jgi:hypothetical protein
MKESPVPDSLRTVVDRFPEFEETIREKFQEDEQFQELCADHGECSMTLAQLQKQSIGPDERIEQYTELLVSLEKEIFARISGPTNNKRVTEE